ncbi:MAG: RagB/SusD family nutrient uptake outer membrane protein [Rikenellaceae bacterium]
MLSSCSDFMTEDNPNYISADIFPTTLEQTSLTLNGVYNTLYDEDLLTIVESSLTADMAYPGYGRNNNPSNASLNTFYIHTYTGSSEAVANKWAILYTGIYRANQTIYYLNRLDELHKYTDEWYSQMAQARLLRGMFHFYLHSVYNHGDIIMFDFVPVEASEFEQPLSPSEDVKAFFRSDFEYAREHLVDEYDDSVDKFRVTLGFANTLSALTYMYDNDFAAAKPYLEAVIDSPLYQLTSADVMFTTDGEFCSESIFEINYQEGLKPELSLSSDQIVTHSLGRESSSSFTPMAWIVDEFQSEVLDTKDGRNWVNGFDGTDQNVRQRSISLRGSAMLATVQDQDTRYYDDEMTTGSSLTSNITSQLGQYRKYIYWDQNDEDRAGDDSRRSGKNIIVNRLSEIYLLYAEVMLEEDNITDALKYINKIRERWGLQLLGEPNGATDHDYDDVSYDVTTLMTHLREIEKPLELVCEGHFIRNIDLRRWGMWKSRYEKLSQQTYYLSNYYYYEPDYYYVAGETIPEKLVANKSESWIRSLDEKGNDLDYLPENEITDYINTVNTFDESSDMWWPIPLIEQTSNGNLYNIIPKN